MLHIYIHKQPNNKLSKIQHKNICKIYIHNTTKSYQYEEKYPPCIFKGKTITKSLSTAEKPTGTTPIKVKVTNIQSSLPLFPTVILCFIGSYFLSVIAYELYSISLNEYKTVKTKLQSLKILRYSLKKIKFNK